MLYPVQPDLPDIVTLYITIKNFLLHSVQPAVLLLYSVQPAILPSYILIKTLLKPKYITIKICAALGAARYFIAVPGTARYFTVVYINKNIIKNEIFSPYARYIKKKTINKKLLLCCTRYSSLSPA
jgi:hypothetical protein